MRLYKISLLFILYFFFSTEINAQEHKTYHKSHIVSTALDTDLNTEREVWIHLPEDYNNTKKYPVVVVLDAEMYFDLTLDLIENREKYGKFLASIIVGIPNATMQERSRNMTFSISKVDQKGEKTSRYSVENSGHAKEFFNFMNDELFQFLAKNYSVEKDNFSLLGHSFGGYFALMQSADASTFNKIIAIDPSLWYSDGEVARTLSNAISAIKNRANLEYYIAFQNGAKHNAENARNLIQFLNKNEVKVYSAEFSNENHGSVFLPALVAVLRELGKNVDRAPRQ